MSDDRQVTVPASTLEFFVALATNGLSVSDLDAEDCKHLAIVKAAMAHPDVALDGASAPRRPSWFARFSDDGNKVLELALRVALSTGFNYISSEHILLAILRQDGNAARILRHRSSNDRLDDEVYNDVITTLPSGGARLAASQQTEGDR